MTASLDFKAWKPGSGKPGVLSRNEAVEAGEAGSAVLRVRQGRLAMQRFQGAGTLNMTSLI